jgi:hypothetical protein
MNAADYEARFSEVGVQVANYRSIHGGMRLAGEKLARARAALANASGGRGGHAVFAVGSMGRMEFTEASDLDVAFVYDRHVLPDPTPQWRHVRSALEESGFEVSDKTFAEPFEIADLTKNIGGEGEKNRSLTYRALLLTEGTWLMAASYAEHVYENIVGVYRDATTTRGRYLTSLSNDLHRYYRTLCVDYRHKVEEQKKEWAIRYVKLRHSRKLWQLGNVALECASFIETMRRETKRHDPEFHDGYLTAHLRDPPLAKVLGTLKLLGRVELIDDVMRAYDRFLAKISLRSVREELDRVSYEARGASGSLAELRRTADALNDATIRVVRVLLAAESGDHLIRYGVL